MSPLTLFYVALTYGCFATCFAAQAISNDADRIFRCASYVTAFMGLGRLLSGWIHPPWSMIIYPAEDMFLMTMCFAWSQVRGEHWATLLGWVFLAELALHLTYWAPALVGIRPHNLNRYIVANNGFFLTILATLYVVGGAYVLAWCGERVQLLRHRHSPGHPSPVWKDAA